MHKPFNADGQGRRSEIKNMADRLSALEGATIPAGGGAETWITPQGNYQVPGSTAPNDPKQPVVTPSSPTQPLLGPPAGSPPGTPVVLTSSGTPVVLTDIFSSDPGNQSVLNTGPGGVTLTGTTGGGVTLDGGPGPGTVVLNGGPGAGGMVVLNGGAGPGGGVVLNAGNGAGNVIFLNGGLGGIIVAGPILPPGAGGIVILGAAGGGVQLNGAVKFAQQPQFPAVAPNTFFGGPEDPEDANAPPTFRSLIGYDLNLHAIGSLPAVNDDGTLGGVAATPAYGYLIVDGVSDNLLSYRLIFNQGTAANRPASAAANWQTTYYENDANRFFYSDQVSETWIEIGFMNPMIVSGDMIYGSTNGQAVRLPGNTSAHPQYLQQTGSGAGVAFAPTWYTLIASGTAGAMPAAGAGNDQTFYWATDVKQFFYSDGTNWYPNGAVVLGGDTF